MRIDDAKRRAVAGHRARPKVWMREEDRDADRGIGSLHQTHDAFGRNDRAIDLDAGSRACRQCQCRHDVLAHRVMHCLRRHESDVEAGAETEQLSQFLILALERHRIEAAHDGRVEASRSLLTELPRGVPALGIALQIDERRDDGAAQDLRERFAHLQRQHEGDERDDDAPDKQEKIDSAAQPCGACHRPSLRCSGPTSTFLRRRGCARCRGRHR